MIDTKRLTYAVHVTGGDADFASALSRALAEINHDPTPYEVVQIAHAANITDQLYVLYSAVIVYREVCHD